MANSSKDKLRNLNNSNTINLPFNNVLEMAISSSDLPCYNQLAGVLRLKYDGDSVSLPRYKMIALMDDTVYCYSKLYRYTKMDLDNYSSKIIFKSNQHARLAWEEIIGSPIIKYSNI